MSENPCESTTGYNPPSVRPTQLTQADAPPPLAHQPQPRHSARLQQASHNSPEELATSSISGGHSAGRRTSSTTRGNRSRGKGGRGRGRGRATTNPQIPAFEPQHFEPPAAPPPFTINNPPLSALGPLLPPTVATFNNHEPEEEDLSEFNDDIFEVRRTGPTRPLNNNAISMAIWSQLLEITAPLLSVNPSTRPSSEHHERLLFKPIQTMGPIRNILQEHQSRAQRSTATPSLETLNYHSGLLQHQANSVTDLMPDAHSQTGTVSLNSAPSSSTRRRRQGPPTNDMNPADPTTLLYYQGTDVYDVLVLAKDIFIATAFATGLFFHHKNSRYAADFKTFALDAIAQASQQLGCTVNADKYILTLLYNTSGSTCSMIKKEARSIVEKEYHLNIDSKDQEGYNQQELTQAESIALKVKRLLDESGSSNMAFTDGPPDKNGNPGWWNHPACREIISKFLFRKNNAPGRKYMARFGPPLKPELISFGHMMAHVCLKEWETGIQVNKNLDVTDAEVKYNDILDGITDAERDSYAGPILQTMYHEWWDYGLEINGLEGFKKQKVYRKTYGPPAEHAEMSRSQDFFGSDAPTDQQEFFPHIPSSYNLAQFEDTIFVSSAEPSSSWAVEDTSDQIGNQSLVGPYLDWPATHFEGSGL